MIFTKIKDQYILTTDINRFQFNQIHDFLKNSYWSPNISYGDVIDKTRNSLCFSILKGDFQIGFARCITDRVSFAYLADVYVIKDHRGKGLSKWMINEILEHPHIKNVKKIILATNDAHELYKKFGFIKIKTNNSIYMERTKN